MPTAPAARGGRLELRQPRPRSRARSAGNSSSREALEQTLGTEILATAAPIVHEGRTVGAVRVTQSVAAVDSAIRKAILGLALLGGVVLVLGLIAGASSPGRSPGRSPPERRGAQGRRRGLSTRGSRLREAASSARWRESFNEMTVESGTTALPASETSLPTPRISCEPPSPAFASSSRSSARRPPDEDPRAKRIDAGLREVDRLSQMVDELLVLSRAGEHDQPATDVDLARVADRALERWQKAADDAGIELARMSPDGSSTVRCTVADLDRTLDALIENAIRYGPPESRVTIVNGPRRIEILDDGPGLEPGEEQAVFERFHRGRAGRQGVKGTGLGLPIARELVEQWGGSVTIANREGRGARAVIEWSQSGPSAGARDRGGNATMTGWLRWTLLALLGLAVAAAISVAASNLVSQRIGLASEPLSAGRALAPPPRGECATLKRQSLRPDDDRSTTTAATAGADHADTPTNGSYPSPPTRPPPLLGAGGGTEHEGGDD